MKIYLKKRTYCILLNIHVIAFGLKTLSKHKISVVQTNTFCYDWLLIMTNDRGEKTGFSTFNLKTQNNRNPDGVQLYESLGLYMEVCKWRKTNISQTGEHRPRWRRGGAAATSVDMVASPKGRVSSNQLYGGAFIPVL